MTAAMNETRMIPLADLRVAEWNARKSFDLETMAKLTDSIKMHGVQVPLIVRPQPGAAGYTAADSNAGDLNAKLFEIVAGHRRFKAAAILKLAELPCIVRELDDVAAREIGLVDNLQREDVPAMEEAEAFGELLERLGSIAAVSARVGKEQAYVAKRLKLRTCTEHTRRALAEQLITVDHALLLARLGEGEQNQALKWALDPQAGSKKPVEKVLAERLEHGRENANKCFGRVWEPETVQKLKEYIEDESGTPLDRAPWPMEEDWLLPDAGSCLDCPKNTKANAPLFGDLDIGEPTCTDGGCFKAKTVGFVQIQGRDEAKKTAQKAGQPPVPGGFEPLRVSWNATSTAPRFENVPICKCGAGKNCKSGEGCRGVPKPAQIFKVGQWVEATKKCEHARAAVTVDWSDANDRGYMGSSKKLRKPGEIVQACVMPKCKAHPKAWERASAAPAQKQESYEVRQAREEKELAYYRAKENPVRRALYDEIVDSIDNKRLLRAAILKTVDPYSVKLALPAVAGGDYTKKVRELIEKASEQDLMRLLMHSAFGRALEAERWDKTAKDKGRGELRKLAELAGVDAAAIERKFDQPAKQTAKKPAPKKPAKKTPAKKAAKKGGKR